MNCVTFKDEKIIKKERREDFHQQPTIDLYKKKSEKHHSTRLTRSKKIMPFSRKLTVERLRRKRFFFENFVLFTPNFAKYTQRTVE